MFFIGKILFWVIYLLEHSPVIAAHRFFYRPDVKLFIKEFILFSPETGCVSKVTNDGVVDAGLTSVMVLIVRTIKWETVLVPKIYSLYNLPEKKKKEKHRFLVHGGVTATNHKSVWSTVTDVRRETVNCQRLHASDYEISAGQLVKWS